MDWKNILHERNVRIKLQKGNFVIVSVCAHTFISLMKCNQSISKIKFQ